MNDNNLIKPAKLSPGDTIGIISPSGAIKDKSFIENTANFFTGKGYNVRVSSNAANKNAYFAGKDSERLSDLTSFFEDREIKGIFCSRGGYGCARILSGIDYNLIKRNPKIFLGYSDITALLLSFYKNLSIVTFHGPLAVADFGRGETNKFTEEYLFKILEGKLPLPHIFNNPFQYECINAGEAEGVLLAGNLSLICSLIGTPYLPDLKNKILLIEEIGEPLYKIDRMLMQLKLSGILNNLKGLLFGEFSSVVKSEDQSVNTLEPIDIIKELTQDVNIPIGYGFPCGHSQTKATLPLGINYYFNSSDFKLELREEYLS